MERKILLGLFFFLFVVSASGEGCYIRSNLFHGQCIDPTGCIAACTNEGYHFGGFCNFTEQCMCFFC
ncbi:hypothetical protein P8452_73478 [Trifolium repens]|nr:hypothetical protein P8452_73478 [Trifolium repens]